MTGPNDPNHRGAPPWGASEAGYDWSAHSGQSEVYPEAYPAYPEYSYPADQYSTGQTPIGQNPNWPPPGPWDGVPTGHAVHPLYPGIPGMGPQRPGKSNRPWILTAGIAGVVVLVLAVTLIVMLGGRSSEPRQNAASPSSPAVGEPTQDTSVVAAPTAAPPTVMTPAPPPPMPTMPPPPPPVSSKQPGQDLAVGDCIEVRAPGTFQQFECNDPSAVFRVVEAHGDGTVCKPNAVAFTWAGKWTYCLAPQLRNGSCYQQTEVAGKIFFQSALVCDGSTSTFRVVFQVPGTTDHTVCDRKPGVRRYFTVAEPPSVICAS